jgi:Holliday junction resolvase-like predicted endonuclease
MAGEALSAQSRTDATDRAHIYAREHLERLGYQLLEDHRDSRTAVRLLILRSTGRHELLFCELRIERLGEENGAGAGLARRRLRRAAHAWLAANRTVHARNVRFDRLSVFVAHDGTAFGFEYVPHAF